MKTCYWFDSRSFLPGIVGSEPYSLAFRTCKTVSTSLLNFSIVSFSVSSCACCLGKDNRLPGEHNAAGSDASRRTTMPRGTQLKNALDTLLLLSFSIIRRLFRSDPSILVAPGILCKSFKSNMKTSAKQIKKRWLGSPIILTAIIDGPSSSSFTCQTSERMNLEKIQILKRFVPVPQSQSGHWVTRADHNNIIISGCCELACQLYYTKEGRWCLSGISALSF